MARQTDIAERALIDAEQAFVFVKSFAAAGIPGDGKIVHRWEFMPRWINSGTTPARRVLLHTSVYVSATAIPDKFDYPNQIGPEETAIDTNLTSIGPGGELMSNPKTIELEDLSHAYYRRQRIFLYGWLDFNDIFPDTQRHRTEFCSEIIVKVDPAIAIVSHGGVVQTGNLFMFRSIGRHNGAEDECYRKPGQTIREVSFEQPSWPPPHGTPPAP